METQAFVVGIGTRDPERTSAAILAAAVKEFTEKGYSGARIDSIAARAGANKRMIYHYFGDKEALYLATEYPFDAAIVDLGLPGLSGLEVIRQLRAHGSRLPVLVLTARGRWQDKVEGLEAGADDYLTKPFQAEELLARLKALLRRAAGSAVTITKGSLQDWKLTTISR